MSVYTYPAHSLIDRVTILKTDGGAIRGYLHASEKADDEKLYTIVRDLSKKGWQCIPYTQGGQPCLEVRGFSRESKLIEELAERGWVEGPVQVQHDKEKPSSLMDKIKKRSLFSSSLAFIIGDAGFFGYGFKDNSKLDMAAGILYAGGTLSSMAFARKDQSDLQIKELSRKMSDYLKNKGVNLPNECSMDAIISDHNKGMIRRADDLFRRYPSELMNLFFAAAGACVAVAATHKITTPASEHAVANRLGMLIKKATQAGEAVDHAHLEKLAFTKMNGDRRLEGWLDVGLGSITAASGLFGMLVKEKKPDPDSPKRKGVQGAMDWVHAHPLAVTGYGYMVSTMCHAVSTSIAWRSGDPERMKAVPLRALFVVTNIIAELLVSISSKGHGHGVLADKSVDNTVVSLAAELIAKQPARMQPLLTQHVAGFLGRPEVLAVKDTNLIRRLQKQVEEMRNNPWAKAERRLGDDGIDQSVEPAPKQSPTSAWQAKLAQVTAAKQEPVASTIAH